MGEGFGDLFFLAMAGEHHQAGKKANGNSRQSKTWSGHFSTGAWE